MIELFTAVVIYLSAPNQVEMIQPAQHLTQDTPDYETWTSPRLQGN